MMSEREGNRFAATDAPDLSTYASEDSLVSDSRAGLTPAQMVERKLVSLMPDAPWSVHPQQAANLRRPLN
jgi:hypothetical protein